MVDPLEAQNPRMISDGAIDLLSQVEGFKDSSWVETVQSARAALDEGIKEGEYGLVVGSGDNSEAWRQKRWATLDIDPEAKSDYVMDANYMADALPKGWDYIYAEAIRMDIKAEKGVHPMRLINQAGALLKEGGTLVIKGANFENNPYSTLPEKYPYAEKIAKLGYDVTTEVHQYQTYTRNGKREAAQKVVYYVKKPVTPKK